MIISSNLNVAPTWHCLFTCTTSVVHLSTFLQTAKSFHLQFWWQHCLKQRNPSNRYDSKGCKLLSRWVALPSLQLQVKMLYFTSSFQKKGSDFLCWKGFWTCCPLTVAEGFCQPINRPTIKKKQVKTNSFITVPNSVDYKEALALTTSCPAVKWRIYSPTNTTAHCFHLFHAAGRRGVSELPN